MPANGITRLYNGTHLSFLAPKAFSNSPLLSNGVQLSHKNWERACFFFLLSLFFFFFFIFLLFLLPSDHPDPPSSFRQVSVGHDSVTLEWIPGFNGGLQQRFRIRWKSQETMSDEQGCVFFFSESQRIVLDWLFWLTGTVGIRLSVSCMWMSSLPVRQPLLLLVCSLSPLTTSLSMPLMQ